MGLWSYNGVNLRHEDGGLESELQRGGHAVGCRGERSLVADILHVTYGQGQLFMGAEVCSASYGKHFR